MQGRFIRLPALALAIIALTVDPAACAPPTAPGRRWVTVERVIDGDTVILTDGRRVRLLGLDAPETGSGAAEPECYAEEAAAFLTGLVDGAAGCLELESDRVEQDVYGRLLAYLWDPEGRMLNEIILREGCAVFIRGDAVRWGDRLEAAGREAQENRRGLWHPDACGDLGTPFRNYARIRGPMHSTLRRCSSSK